MVKRLLPSLSLYFLLLQYFMVNGQSFPSDSWEKIQHPTFSGWNPETLSSLEEYIIDSTATTGMLIVHNGKLIYEFGNIEENSYIASCRKSVLAMLYGNYVSNGTIDLNENLESLAIDKIEPLLDIEKKATVRDLISARSGVYLPASNAGDMQHLAPKRGSVKPGEQWLYNNWDFNIAGYIFEKKTKENIYDALESTIVQPIGMQDWNRALQEKSGNLVSSDVLAYHMWFSARDMARLGLLMLNKGKWKNKQVIEEEWVDEMTSPKSSFEELDEIAPFVKNGKNKFSYGYMWWLWEEAENERLKGAFSAQGAWGQNITVIPSINTVIVIKTNNLYQRQRGDHHHMINQIAGAYDPAIASKWTQLAKNLEEGNVKQFVKDFNSTEIKEAKIDFQTLFNNMGYDYIENGEVEHALEIFKLNVSLNPKSWNLYDSLGEAYFLLGNYPKSKECYKQAMSLNTNNQYGNNKRVQHILERIDLKMK